MNSDMSTNQVVTPGLINMGRVILNSSWCVPKIHTTFSIYLNWRFFYFVAKTLRRGRLNYNRLTWRNIVVKKWDSSSQKQVRLALQATLFNFATTLRTMMRSIEFFKEMSDTILTHCQLRPGSWSSTRTRMMIIALDHNWFTKWDC